MKLILALFLGAVAAQAGDMDQTPSNAATATALAADPADAASGYVCRGINDSGTCQPAWVETAATNGSTNPVTSYLVFDQLALKANLASPTFTGNVTLPGTGIWDTSGNVGIGTTSPGTKLHMSSGTLTVDGTGAAITTTGGLSGASAVIGSGTSIVRILRTTTASTDLGGQVVASCTAETGFAVTGVAVGDNCTVNAASLLDATGWLECRTLADNVGLKYCALGTSDIAAMVFYITTIEY